jgi:hypothetical protein
MRNSLDVYEKIGIARITLEAGLDAGGYVWARFGFTPVPTEWQKLKGVLRMKLGELQQISPHAKTVLERALASGDERSIWLISDLDEAVDGISLGRRLLGGTSWAGHVDLQDDDAMDRYRAYCTSRLGDFDAVN